jgi:integrase
MATVSKRIRDGRETWLARWYDAEGVQRKKTFPKGKEGEAKKWATKMQSAVDEGRYIDPNAGKRTFESYATEWLAAQTFNASTAEGVEIRLRLHAFPVLGKKPLSMVKASTVQAWLKGLSRLAPAYRRTIFTNVSTIFSAAVDDELILKNPCAARAVSKPRVDHKRVVPWTTKQVLDVRTGLPAKYQIVATLAAGLGLRQGEVFGLSPGDVDFLRGTVEVQRQVKVFGGNRLILALPKGGKVRTVPLPDSVRDELAAHLARFPAKVVELPWETLGGKPVGVSLVLTTRESKPLNRNYFNGHVWHPAVAGAGMEVQRSNGCHALRHYYASVLLDAGESIKALSEYLGHSDPGFTLRTYTHMMPTSGARTKKAVDAALSGAPNVPRGAQIEGV